MFGFFEHFSFPRPDRLLFDTLDIIILTYVFYRLLLLIRGTRALQMVVGLLILAIASLISRIGELHATNWILGNLWTIWVLAIVILFQPELRQALAKVGQSSLLSGQQHSLENPHVLDEIVKACVSLAERNVGALIVLRRNTPLQGYMESGISIGGQVSQELLSSIFSPLSPLHDGATIIEDNQLTFASCYLPLTANPDLSRTLGTRHRAAVGLTEETDAVVAVVSEETGHISLAIGGRLTKNLTPADLKQMLFKIFAPKKRGGNARNEVWEKKFSITSG